MADSFFPQLTAGATVQYPFRKVQLFRTIRNVLPDGRLIQLPDPGARRSRWTLNYPNLTFLDVEALRGHFRLCRGPLQSFTFLDPLDNLLVSSESLTDSVWRTGNQLSVTKISDAPYPGMNGHRITNTSQASATFWQLVAAPSNYVFCFSMYVRSDELTTFEMVRAGQTEKLSVLQRCTVSWNRVSMSTALSEASSSLSTGFTLAPGQTLYVSSPQLEAQVAVSDYKPTSLRGGIYSNARYAMPEFVVSVQSPDIFSTSVIVEAGE